MLFRSVGQIVGTDGAEQHDHHRHDALRYAQQGNEQADQRELAGLVDELLQELPEEQRLTFTLHHFADLSLPEVGEILHANTATTKSRLRLAREKLQEKLATRGVHG